MRAYLSTRLADSGQIRASNSHLKIPGGNSSIYTEMYKNMKLLTETCKSHPSGTAVPLGYYTGTKFGSILALFGSPSQHAILVSDLNCHYGTTGLQRAHPAHQFEPCGALWVQHPPEIWCRRMWHFIFFSVQIWLESRELGSARSVMLCVNRCRSICIERHEGNCDTHRTKSVSICSWCSLLHVYTIRFRSTPHTARVTCELQVLNSWNQMEPNGFTKWKMRAKRIQMISFQIWFLGIWFQCSNH